MNIRKNLTVGIDHTNKMWVLLQTEGRFVFSDPDNVSLHYNGGLHMTEKSAVIHFLDHNKNNKKVMITA